MNRANSVRPSSRRRGLRVAGWSLHGAAVLLAAAAARAWIRGTIDPYEPWAIATLLVMAVGSARLGLRLLRASGRQPSYHRVRRPSLVYIAVNCLRWGGRLMPANSHEGGPKERVEHILPAGKARYREACSDLNPRLVLAAVGVVGFGIWLIAAVGGSEKPGPQGLLWIVPGFPALWLLVLIQYLPYGIVLTDSYLTLGVRGVAPAGRAWLRAQVPLDAILQWDVMSRREFRLHKAAYRPVPGRPVGDMLGYWASARHVLWIRADPRQVCESFPELIMPRRFVMVPADTFGYTQNGLLYIGTRRPKSLENALTIVLPGRRLVRAHRHTRP
jgi:hypothetical protein